MRIIVVVAALAACGAPRAKGPSSAVLEPETITGKPHEASGEPPVAPAPPEHVVQKPLDKAAIRRTVRTHLGEITACYEQRLLQDDKLTGTTKVAFTIGTDGRVTQAIGSGFDEQVDLCVATVVKAMLFDAPVSVTEVSYPFTFRPAS